MHVFSPLRFVVSSPPQLPNILPSLLSPRRLRIKTCARTVRDALHERKIYFRRLRSKPKLTDEDIKARFEFAKMYKNKTKAWQLETTLLVSDSLVTVHGFL